MNHRRRNRMAPVLKQQSLQLFVWVTLGKHFRCSTQRQSPERPQRHWCLRKLHPHGDNPAPVQSLSSFGLGSAAVLFGYKPFLLQQCARAETFAFVRALTSATNHFASGQAPGFLKRFVAGGVSIALEKSKTAVRPLACGDPIRRLVAKCFCVAGKEDISKAFRGRNYGVGCPGGVEVVAHSLRDSLKAHPRIIEDRF